MLDWNEYQKKLLAHIDDIGKLNADTVDGHQTLSNAGAALVHSARVLDAFSAKQT